jgi:hypothetical protein
MNDGAKQTGGKIQCGSEERIFKKDEKEWH